MSRRAYAWDTYGTVGLLKHTDGTIENALRPYLDRVSMAVGRRSPKRGPDTGNRARLALHTVDISASLARQALPLALAVRARSIQPERTF